MASDCAFALGCAETCSPTDVKCLVGCKKEVNTHLGVEALREYEACASAIAMGEKAGSRSATSDENGKDQSDSKDARKNLRFKATASTKKSKMKKGDPWKATKKATKNSVKTMSKQVDLEAANNDAYSAAIQMFDPSTTTDPTFADYEACVGCQFVWQAVREDVGNNTDMNVVIASFEEFCQDMPDVFYESCDDMMDQKEYLAMFYVGMMDDLMKDGKKSIVKLCDHSGICGASGAQGLFASSGSGSSLEDQVLDTVLTG